MPRKAQIIRESGSAKATVKSPRRSKRADTSGDHDDANQMGDGLQVGGSLFLGDDLTIADEPDEQILSQNLAEIGELLSGEINEELVSGSISVELSEDPVRLYLKEIGQIHLLDADSEYRLAARIEAIRFINALQERLATEPKSDEPFHQLFGCIYDELITDWHRLEEDAVRMNTRIAGYLIGLNRGAVFT